ncbi:uncharacterized protein LOC118190571 [Stegodyphus dumicola]|uniref:uncharacterized protein LOC118190571 n=1 Tax=Stegodyphus dumicola TaxID=202533 RepID=UPI0015ABFEC9|nr:uncharacterized protein LOC118190571 [Stegodyphus dumicola]
MVRLRHHLTGEGWRRETFLKTLTCLLLLAGLTAASGFKSADKSAPDENLLQHENTSTVPTPETSSISNPPLQNGWRSKRALPDLEISDVYSSDKDLGRVPEGVKKIASKAQGNYIIPYMRPGRSMFSEPIRNIEATDFDFTLDLRNKRNNTIIPTLRYGRRSIQGQTSFIPYMSFGRSDDIYDEFDSDRDLKVKKSGTIIPQARYGRGNKYIYNSKSELNTEKENVDDIWGDESDPTDTTDDDNGFNSEVKILDLFSTPSQSFKTDLNKSIEKRTIIKKTIIPHPRLGRALDKKNIKMKQIEKRSIADLKRQSTDLLLPQIRYGRSVDLVIDKYPTKNRQSESEKSQDFILPYPRPGRSIKSPSHRDEISHAKNANILLPYPRPGRSNKNLEVVSEVHLENNSDQKRQGYMVPFARLGRSDNAKQLGILRDTEMIKQLLDEEHLHDQSLLKIQSKEKNENNDTEESAGIFIIPYPRPGKRQEPTEATFEGRNLENESNEDLQGNEKETMIKEEILKTTEDMEKPNRELLKGIYIVPYPRLGRSDTLVPYPRLGRASDANFMLPYVRLGKKSYDDIIPYPRPGRSSSGILQQYILPHPRFGRQSDAAFMLPYPRLGKKSYGDIIPYPRLGRSNSEEEQQYVLPYPRLGRSPNSQDHSYQSDKGEYIVPLPRLGRSGNSGIMIPYPRPGRSETSDIMLPYPRPGRSESSEIMLPYPRPGRSGESNIMLPYPRPGRTKHSDLMPPYPRIGRSKNSHVMLPYPRPGRSETPDIMLPYPRPGRSENPNIMLSYPRAGRASQSSNKYITPYPRLGRSENVRNMLPPNNNTMVLSNDTLIPQLRYGRSNHASSYVAPYPRLGRSEDRETIIPQPRMGRANADYNIASTNEVSENEMNELTSSEENALLFSDELMLSETTTEKYGFMPYPRVGRSEKRNNQTYIVPYPRLGRSDTNSTVENKHDKNIIIPYPRLGRAEFEAE